VSIPATTSRTEPASPRLLTALWQRFGHLVHEVGKFGAVGAVTFVIDVTVFNLLLDALGPFWATTVSMTVAASLAFVGNRFWTWRHRERSGLRREYLLYFAFNLVGLLISLACLWFSRNALGHVWPGVFQSRLADNVAKNGVGMALGTLFRFWSYRRFVFPEVARPADAERGSVEITSRVP
jgi:putative flippase GtrA